MNKYKKAFTLIELLMVISIISLLSTVIYSYTSETRAKARDSVRLSDMKQVGTAMQMYYQDTGKIPTSFGDLVNNNYLPSIPLDPSTHSAYNFASTPDTVVVSAIYENQYTAQDEPKSVSVAIGDTDISNLCGNDFDYP
ncbi:MAG: type II secretion system protein, partial [Candidatus Taylorbacteria bacterium]|nr:type II secretion system protein [Candidatus Taylorbacteria bacterium]